MIDNPGEDDVGETSAVKSKIQPMPSDQEIAAHEACGQYLYRHWCRACVGGWAVARSQTTVGEHGFMGFLATPFWVVKVKPSMMI